MNKGNRRIEDVMARDVVTIDASATLRDAAQLMRDANVGMLPVMEGNRLRGVVTDRDLVVRAMTGDFLPSSVPVGECLTENPICARPDWPTEQAMAVMAREQIGRLPVIDARNQVVGVVTLSSVALRGHEPEQALEAAQEVSKRSEHAA